MTIVWLVFAYCSLRYHLSFWHASIFIHPTSWSRICLSGLTTNLVGHYIFIFKYVFFAQVTDSRELSVAAFGALDHEVFTASRDCVVIGVIVLLFSSFGEKFRLFQSTNWFSSVNLHIMKEWLGQDRFLLDTIVHVFSVMYWDSRSHHWRLNCCCGGYRAWVGYDCTLVYTNWCTAASENKALEPPGAKSKVKLV